MNIKMHDHVTTLFAHRGDPVHAPENTIASFHSAMQKGAKAVEMDVRRTQDGQWVVFHDRTLRRTTSQTGRLARARWSTIQLLEVGGWFSPKFKGEPIPLLSDALLFCRNQRLGVFLDVKENRSEKELYQVVNRSGWAGQISIGAGTLKSLQRWRKLLKESPLFWVTGYRTAITPRRVAIAVRLGFAGFVSYRKWITQTSIRRVHDAGLKINVWTIETPQQWKQFARLGVDAMMSEIWPPPSIS